MIPIDHTLLYQCPYSANCSLFVSWIIVCVCLDDGLSGQLDQLLLITATRDCFTDTIGEFGDLTELYMVSSRVTRNFWTICDTFPVKRVHSSLCGLNVSALLSVSAGGTATFLYPILFLCSKSLSRRLSLWWQMMDHGSFIVSYLLVAGGFCMMSKLGSRREKSRRIRTSRYRSWFDIWNRIFAVGWRGETESWVCRWCGCQRVLTMCLCFARSLIVVKTYHVGVTNVTDP